MQIYSNIEFKDLIPIRNLITNITQIIVSVIPAKAGIYVFGSNGSFFAQNQRINYKPNTSRDVLVLEL